MVSKSRMPPPSWTGTASPTACTMALMAVSFLGRPANAPLRSIKCSRRAPSFIQCCAMAPGSSENTVTFSIAPCCRRTQCPSLRSIAGISSIAAGAKPGVCAGERKLMRRGAVRERQALPSYNRPCAGKKSISGSVTGERLLDGVLRSGRNAVPNDEIGQQLQPEFLTLLRMELHCEQIISRHRAREGRRVRGIGSDRRAVTRDRVVAVHEIEATGLRDPAPQGMLHSLLHFVPPHVRDLEFPAAGPDQPGGWKAHDPARQQPQARHIALLARIEQHLKADADT